ncbi:MAG: hypothetical protein AAFQ64_06820 [Pseudomonadota bacterium]
MFLAIKIILFMNAALFVLLSLRGFLAMYAEAQANRSADHARGAS